MEYDAAGVVDGERPPAELVGAVARAALLVASDLPRAAASAALLAPAREVTVSPLFREVPLPIPRWLPCRAPLAVWDALIHLRWGLDAARGRPASPEALDRARRAAEWCRDVREGMHADATVAVVTHGVFRRLLAQRLLDDGWSAAAGRRSYAHWSVWRLDASRLDG